MKQSKRMAFCGMMTALGVVLLLLGGYLGIGTYAAPMVVGLLILPGGKQWGVKYHILIWLAISLLALFLVSDLEESLMFLCFFGWYPIVHPALNRLPRVVRWVAKFLTFNIPVVAVEAALILLFVPEDMGAGLLIALFVIGNVLFIVYDRAIHRIEQKLIKRLNLN